KGHLFFRWDEPQGKAFGVSEVFNVDGAGYGIGSYPDDYYRRWPSEWTDAELVGGLYLKSMTPAQELAAFLVTRAECLIDNHRLEEATQSYGLAVQAVPDDIRYRANLGRLLRRQYLEDMHTLPRRKRALPVGP